MKINPYRAIPIAIGCAVLLGVIYLLCTLTYYAIVEGWWPTPLKWIGGIVAIILVAWISESWQVWEDEWDKANAPKPELCAHGKVIETETINCLECLCVPSDNPDDEAREIYEAIQAEGQAASREGTAE